LPNPVSTNAAALSEGQASCSTTRKSRWRSLPRGCRPPRSQRGGVGWSFEDKELSPYGHCVAKRDYTSILNRLKDRSDGKYVEDRLVRFRGGLERRIPRMDTSPQVCRHVEGDLDAASRTTVAVTQFPDNQETFSEE